MNFIAVLYEILGLKFKALSGKYYAVGFKQNIQFHQKIDDFSLKVQDFSRRQLFFSTVLIAPLICLEGFKFFSVRNFDVNLLIN